MTYSKGVQNNLSLTRKGLGEESKKRRITLIVLRDLKWLFEIQLVSKHHKTRTRLNVFIYSLQNF